MGFRRDKWRAYRQIRLDSPGLGVDGYQILMDIFMFYIQLLSYLLIQWRRFKLLIFTKLTNSMDIHEHGNQASLSLLWTMNYLLWEGVQRHHEAWRRSERHKDGFAGHGDHSSNLEAWRQFLRASWRLCTPSLYELVIWKKFVVDQNLNRKVVFIDKTPTTVLYAQSTYIIYLHPEKWEKNMVWKILFHFKPNRF